ncbi:MAG: DASS family sodium-coupled anion symporter [Deltaproteobacteria bacterium]|nr:DASS family sodium-coupled anion symporter [Deltaproteobacteria bacterium]
MQGEGVITAGESRFETVRRRSGLIGAPLVFAAVWLAAPDLPAPAHRLAAILAAVVVLWVSEAIPMAMTAFIGVAAAVVLQVAPAAAAFAPFADPLIFLFIGTFMLAQAIFFHGLDRRFAFAILGLPGVGQRPGRILVAYALVACLISMWISNTATTAMMFPIGVSLLAFLESHRQAGRLPAAYGTVLLLSNAFAASIGGLATPVGTPPNLIGIGFIRRETGMALPFFTWMALAAPVAAVLFAWAVFNLRRSGVRGNLALSGVTELIQAERAALGPWTRGQINTMVAFGSTVALWVLPGVVALIAGQEHPLYRQLAATLPEGAVALLGAGLLFILPINLGRHEFTLSWAEAVKIDWWIVFLYGGGIALGTLAFQTGLADALGRGLTGLLGVRSSLGLLALSTALATVLSETTSNTASANMVVPVVIAFARSAGIDPVLPAIGATMGASLGFMLPVSTPCNAIVYGSGRIPLTAMMRHGVLLDVAGVVAIIAVLGLLGPLILGR